jgi:hypothetical protein
LRLPQIKGEGNEIEENWLISSPPSTRTVDYKTRREVEWRKKQQVNDRGIIEMIKRIDHQSK